MKNTGKQFEDDFSNSFPKTMFLYRLRDSSGAWGGSTDKKVRFTPSNYCDFVAHNLYKGETMLLELKTTSLKSLPLSNLKKSQLEGMKKSSVFEGVKCYFIVNFRSVEETYAIPIDAICFYSETTDKKSIPLSFFQENGVLLPARKLTVNYRYELDNLLK